MVRFYLGRPGVPSFLFAMGNAMSFPMGKIRGAEPDYIWEKSAQTNRLDLFIRVLDLLVSFFRANDGRTGAKTLSRNPYNGCSATHCPLLLYRRRTSLLPLGKEGADPICPSSYGDIGPYTICSVYRGKNWPCNQYRHHTRSILLGDGHIYKGDVIPFDREGILSTLPAVVNVVGGYMAGTFIQRKGKSFEGIAKLMIAGGLRPLALGWDSIFPIGKKSWTSPFLYTIGIDLLVMVFLSIHRN